MNAATRSGKAEMIGYLTIAMVVALLAILIYAQSAMSALLDHFRNSPELLKETGAISDLYFLADLPMCRYGFVKYLYKHPVPEKDIAQAFPDYSRLRKISNFVFGAHIFFGLVLIVGFIGVRVFR